MRNMVKRACSPIITFVKDSDTGAGNYSLHRQQKNGRNRTGFGTLPRHARPVYDKYSACGLPDAGRTYIAGFPAHVD
jgi:hypothetical protein